MIFEFMSKYPITIVFAIFFIGFVFGYNFDTFIDKRLNKKEDVSDENEEI